jgi:hypothetical protein
MTVLPQETLMEPRSQSSMADLIKNRPGSGKHSANKEDLHSVIVNDALVEELQESHPAVCKNDQPGNGDGAAINSPVRSLLSKSELEEPLLQENKSRFVLFPIKYTDVSVFPFAFPFQKGM